MPCMEVFERQDKSYKDCVLPPECKNRVAIEAGVTALWYRYADRVVGTDDFGFSAKPQELFDAFSINEESISS